MKKTLSILLLLLLFYPSISQASPAEQRLRGRILLQVEQNGEAWYVRPDDGMRMYMKDGDAAYQLMRNYSLGISNADLAKIPVGFEDRFECTDSDNDGLCDKLEVGLGTDINNSDSDNDGYNDGTEVRNNYDPLSSGQLHYDLGQANRLKGKILLQVESHGEAWYIHPDDGKRYYMPDGDAAYQIMRFLSLGITNNDLAKIDADGGDNNQGSGVSGDNNNSLTVYQSQDGSFSFQYPENNWTVNDSLSISLKLYPTDSEEKIDDNNYWSYISIDTSLSYPSKCNDEKSCADYYTNFTYGGAQASEEKYIDMTGGEALYQVIQNSKGNDDVLVHYIVNDTYYRFWLKSSADKYSKYLIDFNTVLDSFSVN